MQSQNIQILGKKEFFQQKKVGKALLVPMLCSICLEHMIVISYYQIEEVEI